MTNDTGAPGNDQQALLAQLQAMLDQQSTNPTMTPEQIAQAETLIAQSKKAKASQDAADLIAQLQGAAPAAATPAAAAPAAAPAAAAPVAAAAVPAERKKSPKALIIGLVSGVAALALIAAGLVAFGIIKLPGTGATVPNAGEVFLLAADDLGPDPFSSEDLAADVPPIAESVVTVSSSTAVPAATPGLYGGSGNKAVCDPLAQANFLAQNPALAAAWVKVLSSDPNVRLRNGDPLTVDNISQFLAGLTPVILTSDTRVTNHGYYNGEPTVIPAVLQAGTGVMVDQFGTPLVKCNCGNPLLPPTPITGTVTYTGDPWAGWSGSPNIVQPAPEPLTTLTLVDVATGQTFEVPVCQPYVTSGSPFCLDPSQVTAGAGATPQPQPTSTPAAGATFVADLPGFGDGTFSVTQLGNNRLAFGTPGADFVRDANGTLVYPGQFAQVTHLVDGSTVADRVAEAVSSASSLPWTTGDCAAVKEEPYNSGGWTGSVVSLSDCTNANGETFTFTDYTVVAEKDGNVVIVWLYGADGSSFPSTAATALDTFRVL